MEIFDIYNIDREKTDRTMTRGEKTEKGDFRLVVHACIFNSKGQMLIQQRQPFKDGWPNMWDVSVGGSAIAGETSRDAVKRELAEELGIDFGVSSKRPHLTINFEGAFDDVYLFNEDININSLKLQYEEVQAVRWAFADEIIEMIREGIFIPYYENYIKLLFDMRERYGAANIKN